MKAPTDFSTERFATARATADAEAEMRSVLERIHRNPACPKLRARHAELRKILAGGPIVGTAFQVELDN